MTRPNPRVTAGGIAACRSTVDTGIPIYLCDPHSLRQQRANENSNRLLRQDVPTGTDLSVHVSADLDRFASLDNRPRRTLGYTKPSEELAGFLAVTGRVRPVLG